MTGHVHAKRLTRRPEEGKLGGVCAGIAEYLDTDVTVVRLMWLILSVVPGAVIGGLVAYAAAWLLLPEGGGSSERSYAGKRLVRSTTDRKLAGVCGGIADFLDLDPTVVRIAAVILAIYPGAIVCGALIYVLAWIVVPPAPGASFAPSPARS